MGKTWIELVGVVDGGQSDPRAQMFSQAVSAGDRLLGWALVAEDLDAVAARLQLPVSKQHATHVITGERFTWRQVGFDETRMHYYLPFFIGWDHDVHADMDRATEEVGNARVGQADLSLELTGDPARLEQWLGDVAAPISISEGPPSITAHIPTDRGQLTVR